MALNGLTAVGRAFAVWPGTLQVMPGGILDTSLGRFFVGVRISNGSAAAWPATQIRIGTRGRRILENAGFTLTDNWSSTEGSAFEQNAADEWITVPPLQAGEEHTIYLKLDVSSATPGRHTLELEQRDPIAPASTHQVSVPLLVAQTVCDGSRRTFVSKCDEGTLKACWSAMTLDQETFRLALAEARRVAATGERTPAEAERLRLRFQGLFCGAENDVCEVMSDITSSCAAPISSTPSSWVGSGRSGMEFLGYPTTLQYGVTYNGAFAGKMGPQAFELVPWQALLASAALQFDLGLPGPVAQNLVAIADQAVVGTVQTTVLNALVSAPAAAPASSDAGSVDVAIATARGNRSLGAPLGSQLDAATGEANAAPIDGLDGVFTPSGFVTNAEIDAALSGPVIADLRVHKSGAGTGVTRGVISALLPVVPRTDAAGTLHFVNQLLIVPDLEAPAADDKVAGAGDSGALWIQTSTNRVIAMTHAVGGGGSVASRIQDVVDALQIELA